MRVLLYGLGAILTNALDYRLRKFGYRIVRVADASEALNRIHAGHADILITSVHIEGYRLTNFIGLIREDFGSTMPIILVTEPEGGDNDVLLAGLEAGADDFVTFPFKPSEVALRIKLLLHRLVHP